MDKCKENLNARNVPTQGSENVDEEMQGKVFAFYNSQNADTDGIALQDFLAGTKAVMDAIKAKMA